MIPPQRNTPRRVPCPKCDNEMERGHRPVSFKKVWYCRACGKVLLLLILAGLFIWPVMGQLTTEEKYQEEFDKLKDTSSYVTLNDKGEMEYLILNYDPAYEYYIRIYSHRHINILQEYPIKEPSGVIPFKYPGLNSKIHINLQKWIPEGKEEEYCHSYPCKIGENLDIFTTSILERVPSSDLYTYQLRYWTRSDFDKINGASWQAKINTDDIK